MSDLITRKGTIAQASPQRRTALRNAAESLSLRNVDQAVCELLNEALARLILLCYEQNEHGYCNIDGRTGRILIPVPWGKAGYAHWSLTPTEGDTMRRIMLTRARVGLPLFAFDRGRRAWFLNLADFPEGAVVLAQLKEWEISVGEYREARG